ncbi:MULTISPECIES: acyl-CoA dehydrogenase family protein [unclassified Cupriavidus]|uniref:acyl-CoA dehydrogenase family protein n=1 Tax=unclassified Cupriavidus TaxID=2640874 RepID=UPI003F90AD97
MPSHDMILQPPNPRYYTAEHEAFRASVRRFFDKEVAPNAEAWDEAESFPRELYRKAAEAGLLQPGFPEAYGGAPCDAFYRMILFEERAWGGSGGIASGLFSHTIGAPPIAAAGSEALKARVLPQILAGEKISALAISEPAAGSDVAHLATTARRDGDHYVVNGTKLYITSGMRADYFTVAVRTGGPDARGVSLLLIERDTPGFTRTPLKKMGWWASDTAQLFFEDCRVPAENLIGEEGKGFAAIMKNFNHERLALAAAACGYAQVCFHDALAWARERQTFGKRLVEHQVVRHQFIDMATRIESTRAMLDDLASRLDDGAAPVAQIAMAKNLATQTFQFCADRAVQLLGGMGYMRGSRVERLYREVKVMMIGGGAEEIMKDLAARQLGL